MLETIHLARRSAFAGFLKPVNASARPGVTVSERTDLQLASLISRGGRERITVAIRSAYGFELPDEPKRVAAERIAFLGTGPRSWIAMRTGGGSLVSDLERVVGDGAAVSDQSDGYGVLRLSGKKVRATFEKGLAIDLHPQVFRRDDAAVTTCAHLSVILWQLDDAPVYEVAMFRSLAPAFWHWLSDSAAEFGLSVTTN